MKFIFLLVFVFSFTNLFSQNIITKANIQTTAVAGTGDSLPFWFLQNNLGKYSKNYNVQELTEGEISGEFLLSGNKRLFYGTDLAILAKNNDFDLDILKIHTGFNLFSGCFKTHFDAKIIQLYAGLKGKILTIKAGTFSDEEILGGLSSSNGEIVRSLNYRPYPMVRLSTSGYIPFIFAHKWFRFKAEYDEGLLHDNRVIYHPHLHHKSLDMLFLVGNSWQITAGFNHYVFWGGTSSDGEKLPGGFSDYLRYISGSSGSSDFWIGDQINVAGDQLGSYRVTAKKDLDNYSVQFRICHLFEDNSGMRLKNWRDNLLSLYIVKKKNHTFLDEFLAEFLYTKDQSPNSINEYDNYFNHSVYRTGFSYKGFCMGDPLFYPLKTNSDGVYSGFENNRISSFNFGAKGFFTERINYKAILSYSHNFGTYGNHYDYTKKQFSSMFKISMKCRRFPLDVYANFAADFGDLLSNSLGLGIGCRWNLY